MAMSSVQPLARAVVVAALLLVPTLGRAAVTGSISGTVIDQATGKKLAGVTVTATSPALQGETTEFTDADGHYILTELPPGAYLLRFYFANLNVERPDVNVQPDKTLSVNVSVPTQKAEVKTIRIIEQAPNVDVGNTQVQTAVTSELVRNTPVLGRTYAAVLTMAPGAATDPVGLSFNGGTGSENNFLIDGVNTTDPAFGLLGTQLSLEFIGETEIITGGYNAEYGRATGGVVNVVTKSGSNNFHGDIWFNVTPFQVQPNLIGRTGEAVARRARTKYGFDLGFDIGGPIVKDKVWFYAGFQPTFTTVETTRYLRTRTSNNLDDGLMSGTYQGDLQAASCPKGLLAEFCNTPNVLAPAFATQLLGDEYSKKYTTDTRLYNWIAKLNFQINADNNLMVQYVGSPQTTSGPVNPFGIFNGADSQLMGSTFQNTHDASLKFVSKLLGHHLQIDIVGGYHYADTHFSPAAGGNDQGAFYASALPLALFEPNVTPCAAQVLHGVNFNPCPVQNYAVGGWGFIGNTTAQRISAQASATYFARLGGTHALKLGFDFEDNLYKDSRNYSGGAFYEVDTGGAITINRQFTSKDLANGPNGVGIDHSATGFAPSTSTLNYGAYLRDSYNVGFVPGLTVNAGVRYEAQQVRDINGNVGIGIYDNWAPRVGAVYDFTRKGRSKIFASYGWFYESIPLDINDRAFSTEGILSNAQPGGGSACTTPGPGGIYDLSKCTAERNPANAAISGGTLTKVSPTLQGMYSEEVVAGIQYDVGLDMVLGASYIHRDLGRIIEDVSPDGGSTFFIANPGQAPDADAVKKLQRQIASTTDPTKKADLQSQLSLYQGISTGFPKPTRNYDAMVLTATKRLSHNFLLLASYTYSRTLGNYPGTFQASNSQLDPNISTQYDLRELLFNRAGPLPNDRPHNVKVQGSYFVPFGANTMVFGLAFNALSGTPIEVLGRSPVYGRGEAYILPRGSGGRLPMLTQFDLHIAYKRQLSRLFGFEASADVFNLFNQQQVTGVDQEYTASSVNPIQNGKVADLARLVGVNGTQPLLNPNYGHATIYQAPLSMRLGVRLSF
jgi:carboxypeptidase family protein